MHDINRMRTLIIVVLTIIAAIAILHIATDYQTNEISGSETVMEILSEYAPKYQVEFMSMWGNDSRINNPPNPHTGNMFLVSHNDKFKLFEVGQYANKGVSQTAMFGTLDDLYTVAKDNKEHIGNVVTSGVLSTPGKTDLVIEMTPIMSQISFVTMVAPSSDWFTGFSIDLMKNGGWIDKTIIPLYAYIAGTDSNQGFVTEHKPRAIPEPIKINQSKILYPAGQVIPIAYAIINRMKI